MQSLFWKCTLVLALPVFAATAVSSYITSSKSHCAFLARFEGWKLCVSLSIENNVCFSKRKVIVEELHDCLSSQMLLEILNLLCKLFGAEILVLPCLWTVLIPVATIMCVPMQPDTNHFTDKLENPLSVTSFQSSSTVCWILLCTLIV